MPRDKNGEVFLDEGKGMLCWLCIILWWLGWWGIAWLVSLIGGPEWLCLSIGIFGGGLFGIVPTLFFWHESKQL